MVSLWTCESYATYFVCILSKQCSILKISLLLLSKIGIHFTVLTQISELILAGEAVFTQTLKGSCWICTFPATTPREPTFSLHAAEMELSLKLNLCVVVIGSLVFIDHSCLSAVHGIWVALIHLQRYHLFRFICWSFMWFLSHGLLPQIMNGKSGGLREFWLVPLPGNE